MLLEYLSVENFGPFYGPNHLELSPSEDGKRSVILIGADNGAGKTTLLSALKLCLYGKRAPELWDGGQQGYRQYIGEKFNNVAFQKGERQAVFEIGLKVWDQKIPSQIVIRRSFQITDNRLFLTDQQETLEVLRNGKPLDHPVNDSFESDSANQYDELLRLLIPSHLAQFYFFDGERVRELFRKTSAENISQSIRDLLGLTLFERLSEDLRDYRRSTIPRMYGKFQDKRAQVTEAVAEREKVHAEIGRSEAEQSEIQEDLENLARKITEKEEEFKRQGGMHQAEIDEIRQQLQQCELDHTRITTELKETLADRISQVFLLSFKDEWDDRLNKENARRQWLARRDAIEPHIKLLVERLVGPSALKPNPALTDSQRTFFAERIEQEVKGLFHPPPTEASHEFWFDFRQEEIDSITKQFSDAQQVRSGRLKELIEEKERVTSLRKRLTERVQGLGDTEVTQNISDQLQQLLEQRGGLNQRRTNVEADISHANERLAESERRITNLERECEKSEKGQVKSDLSTKIEQAVKDYIALAKVQRVDAIEKQLNKLFLAMANCRDEIRELRLDRNTYEIAVIDVDGNRRPIETGLSAGQAQVLAMAFVGALAKASGRVLPRIMNTPLGRLDVNHRRDVTRYFFIEHASPQTILLSTPTEINNCLYDNERLYLFDDLRTSVARVMTLVKKGNGRTVIENHYFGNKLR